MSTKDKHYWNQLRAALTAGQWAAQYPAKAPNGTLLSWSELFRKFNKHCGANRDITEVASQTQALSLLLAANSKDQDRDDSPPDGRYALELGGECLLAEERIQEAKVAYDVLKKIESSNFDTLNFALAYYAYALGNPSECLAYLQKVPDVSHINEHIPQPASRTTTVSLQVPGNNGATPSISSVGTSQNSASTSASAETNDGRAWALTESLRSICLQGMSHEKLYPSEPDKALAAYSSALPLLSITESELISSSAPIPPSGKLNFASFTRFRELWRWVESIIWRAISLGAQICDINREDTHNVLWTWLSHYSTCTSSWPPNFRTNHRCAISVLYIRALVLRNASPDPPADLGKPPSWLHTARSVIQDYRAILSTFVLPFGEASGAVGDYAGWVIDVLWWATRMTFNSYRIMRHMTRLLQVSGDLPLAKRTLKLYVQIVSKAWQASNSTVTEDTDTNKHWVETLVSGARMLCKDASLASEAEGINDVRDAGKLITQAKTRLDIHDAELVAMVDLAEGVWNTLMVLKERDDHTRSRRLADAHASFLKAVEGHPTAAAYYHLALSFARPGPSYDLDQAIVNAGLAVEGDPKEIRCWHLIGLLLAASEQWKAAEEIFERGAALGEPTLPEDDLTNGNFDLLTANANGRPIDGLPVSDSIHPVMERVSVPPPAPPPVFLVEQLELGIPPPATLLLATADHPSPSRQEKFEYSLQLRMSQAALSEVVDGAEGAESKWLEVFQWIAERRGITAAVPESGRPSPMNNLKSPSELVLTVSRTSHDKGPADQQETPRTSAAAAPPSEDALLPPPQISIQVQPATPDEVSWNGPDNKISERISEEGPVTPTRVNGTNGSSARNRSLSIDRDTSSKSKKMQQKLINRVNEGGARISRISKKIGSGVVRPGTLRRSSSTPDFHAVLRPTSYQASSIHSRRRIGSLMRRESDAPSISPPPPPPLPPPPAAHSKWNHTTTRETRLESDLWLMSAATFRRLGKIEQAKGAIQEAEVKDEGNPGVWVQLGLYHLALGQTQHAIDALQKALFINPDHVPASVHLCRIYLTPDEEADDEASIEPSTVDLVAGMLSHLSRGPGWDVPEVWFFLAKAYRLQRRKERERECLHLALQLSERRGVREVTSAVGWCI
ncbi:hypothetical protein MIND_01307200 [Mycena indigotica]|uniref:TPR-like protein n=1 Tax=Mycena indigotica TaxID=2126181 RepID=A0A8H6VR48_9AGAR|nr:uncharacterized protein MIND_01307200 [Mycena indigotica]KAF7290669.1 hypothetical protein MIND_01307200 [Mycena indigotica]